MYPLEMWLHIDWGNIQLLFESLREIRLNHRKIDLQTMWTVIFYWLIQIRETESALVLRDKLTMELVALMKTHVSEITVHVEKIAPLSQKMAISENKNFFMKFISPGRFINN